MSLSWQYERAFDGNMNEFHVNRNETYIVITYTKLMKCEEHDKMRYSMKMKYVPNDPKRLYT
jgi:hypothetical protein